MDIADSFVNWGFNPEMRKGGEYFIVSNSYINSDFWPSTIQTYNHIFNKGEFLALMDTNTKTDEIAQMMPITTYTATQLQWGRVLGACKTYRDMGLEGEGLNDIIKWINELDFDEWVETGKSGGVQDRAWRYDNEDGESAYSIDFGISKTWISVSVGEQPPWGDPLWAMQYVIRRVVI